MSVHWFVVPGGMQWFVARGGDVMRPEHVHPIGFDNQRDALRAAHRMNNRDNDGDD